MLYKEGEGEGEGDTNYIYRLRMYEGIGIGREGGLGQLNCNGHFLRVALRNMRSSIFGFCCLQICISAET